MKNIKTIKNWEQFNESASINEKLSTLQIEYRVYFKEMLAIYDVKSPAKLSEEKKKDFFDNIKKYWTKGSGAIKIGQDLIDIIKGK